MFPRPFGTLWGRGTDSSSLPSSFWGRWGSLKPRTETSLYIGQFLLKDLPNDPKWALPILRQLLTGQNRLPPTWWLVDYPSGWTFYCFRRHLRLFHAYPSEVIGAFAKGSPIWKGGLATYVEPNEVFSWNTQLRLARKGCGWWRGCKTELEAANPLQRFKSLL